MDPFTLAMMAIGAVKSGVAMYKEAKAVGKEAMGVMTEISTGLSNFFEHQDKAVKQDEEKRKNPPKGKSLQAIALENVIRKKQLEQAEYDLRQALIYDSPPELGAIWEDFQAERARLKQDQAKFDAAQKKRMHVKLGRNKRLRTSGHFDSCSVYLFSQLRSQFLGSCTTFGKTTKRVETMTLGT